jgi:hypothetical protein
MPKLVSKTKNKVQNVRKFLLSPDIRGHSYLLNPKKLLMEDNDSHVAQYILLASYRNFADYRLFGITYLDISFIPDIDLTKYKYNPLIKIEDNKIYFKYN